MPQGHYKGNVRSRTRHPPKSKLQVFLFGSVSKIYWA
ncbi:hypothetical protein NC653_008781 [Populus alba x Populus x berolinensis]|uniref:Uncharacterized protein n=1 Tax=Populus alba x Populus x berolinensis TaxID=444605 RepID=A0AAD6R7D2_9ROSI|nr:hypothetical protein NC653_008781 [Populus alba x Populus x berolinensis]